MPKEKIGYIKIPFILPDFEEDMMMGLDRNFKEIERLFNVLAKTLNEKLDEIDKRLDDIEEEIG